MRPSFRAALGNALLLIISVGATYLVASFVIFRFLLPHLSFNLHPHFPDIAEVFAQTSKAGTEPRDYIALLGDSYAEGQGDGLIAAGGDRARFVHSAHVLHGLTRRDVVNLGLGGAGSVQAMVRQPARILMGDCFLYPRLDPPRRIFVYFYEGNDLEENGYIAGRVAAEGAVTRETIARYVGDHYGTPPKFRCFTDLGETTFKMAHFLITNADTFEALRKPSTRNNVFSGGTPHAAPALQKPPAEMEAGAREAALTVFDVSLEWLRRNFSAAVTLVYVPSPAAIYRPAEPSVDVYTRWPVNEVRAMPAADIYAASQRTCEQIRALALARGARFLDMRPALRAAAATTVIHGPQDWNHFNATGYRVLGETLARSIDEEQSTDCRDWHQPRAVLPSPGGGGSTRTQ